ncbi:MAG: SoxR reducing system RseC family protein [Bacteroidales bacterium]|jgi:sigma-E factor negative regulatory protein RseC|nr:SoxR reducing system RseC family protein [Bacteroidales bacterium]
MKESNCLNQIATVIERSNNAVKVVIHRQSACASCHAKAACTSLDKKDQTINVKTNDAQSYEIGEEVQILIAQSLGLKAVVLAFIVPLIVLLAVVIVLTKYFPTLNQSIIAVIALLSYFVYCFLLYSLRNKIDRHFVLKIQHLHQ